MNRALFDELVLPEGLRHADDFLTPEEEHRLLDHFQTLEFHQIKMRGVVARRRVIQYGWKYNLENFKMTDGPPIPSFLIPVRDRAADFAGLPAEQLSEGLIMEYAPGATIGWHRDAPGFGVVVGISLGAAARFRFRRGKTGAWETTELRLEPRSIYVLEGPARSQWQHSIPAGIAMRYSITFRTVRAR